jgi:hypothetical protein
MRCYDATRRWRPNRKKLRYVVRASGMRKHEREKANKLKRKIRRWALAKVALQRAHAPPAAVRVCALALIWFTRKWYRLCRWTNPNLPPLLRYNKSIQFYINQPTICEEKLRFEARHLRRVFNVLRIPAFVKLSNGSRMTGEEIFLFSLNRLSFPRRIVSAAREEFGRENSQWTRAFDWFINHILVTFKHLLFSNLPWWSDYFDAAARAVQSKMGEHGLLFPAGQRNNIAMFIDDTLRRTCRPGPVNAPDVQEAFYNGWKKCHCLKYQTGTCT